MLGGFVVFQKITPSFNTSCFVFCIFEMETLQGNV